jgi:hypothetical protein
MDMSTYNIKKLFEKQISELTKRSLNKEELFDFQLSRGWLK